MKVRISRIVRLAGYALIASALFQPEAAFAGAKKIKYLCVDANGGAALRKACRAGERPLLPGALNGSAGPAGPKGDKGDPGVKGEKGETGYSNAYLFTAADPANSQSLVLPLGTTLIRRAICPSGVVVGAVCESGFRWLPDVKVQRELDPNGTAVTCRFTKTTAFDMPVQFEARVICADLQWSPGPGGDWG